MKATTKGRPCFNDINEDEVGKMEMKMRTPNYTIRKARVIRKLRVLTGNINPVESSLPPPLHFLFVGL